MANELTVNIQAGLVNGNLREDFNFGPLRYDQAVVGAYSSAINVGTSEEVVATGDIGTFGYAFFRNTDATNYVDVGPESGGAMVGFLRIKAGQVAGMPLKPGITIRAQANTGAVKLFMLLLEA